MSLIKEFQEIENKINEKLKDNNIVVKILEKEDETKGTIEILKDGNMNKKFEFEEISCCQIDTLENNKIVERGLFVDCLAQWLFNLYNPIEYLYAFYCGNLNGKVLNRDAISKISDSNTIDFHEEREKGLLVHRKELDNQPMVKDYIGPMFDKIDYGKVYLRYETQEVYNMLSN